MVLAPLPRLALMDQKITPALVSFDSLSGIRITCSLLCSFAVSKIGPMMSEFLVTEFHGDEGNVFLC